MTDRTADRTADRTLPKSKKRVEVYQAGFFRRSWAVRFTAADGSVALVSESYHTKGAAILAANLVKNGFQKIPLSVEDADRTPRGLAPDPEGL